MANVVTTPPTGQAPVADDRIPSWLDVKHVKQSVVLPADPVIVTPAQLAAPVTPVIDYVRLAVMPRMATRGVYAPGFVLDDGKKHTFDWRQPPGSAANTAHIRDSQLVWPIEQALRYVWPQEQMCVGYLVADANGQWLERQPRVNKDGLPWLRAQGYTVWQTVVLIDIDNPNHGEWTQELLEKFWELLARVPLLRRAGIYMTLHGWRIVLPLDRPVPIEQAEAVLRGILHELEMHGVGVDWQCSDWGHIMRMPKTVKISKTGVRSRVDFEPDLDSMELLDPSPYFDGAAKPKRPKKPKAPKPPRPLKLAPDGTVLHDQGPVDEDEDDEDEDDGPVKPRRTDEIRTWSDLPDYLGAPIAELGKAIQTPGVVKNGTYHSMYLALAGALLGHSIPHEYVPEIVYRIALAANSRDPVNKRAGAMDTIRKHAAGHRTTGIPVLVAGWPQIARALDRALARGARAILYAKQAARVVPPIDEGRRNMDMAFIGAGQSQGITPIKAQCGFGKTTSAQNAAVQRSKTAAIGSHVPGTKTSISFDKNILAIQSKGNIIRADGLVKRYRSPLSVVDAQGKPVCVYHEAGEALAEGGQSMHWEFCEGRKIKPCEHRPPEGKCKAYGQIDQDDEEESRIAVGTHALLNKLDVHAGGTGLVVVDEPPPPLESVKFPMSDFELVIKHADAFAYQFNVGMMTNVLSLYEWAKREEVRTDGEIHAIPLEMAMVLGVDHVDRFHIQTAIARLGITDFDGDADAMFQCVLRAMPEKHRSKSPPIKQLVSLQARNSPQLAKGIGRASALLKMLYRFTTEQRPHSEFRCVVRVDNPDVRGDPLAKTVVITGPNMELAKILRRKGPVVLADACIDVHVPIIEAMMSKPGETPLKLNVLTFEAADRAFADDGTPILITRVNWRLPHSSRGGWLVSGKPLWISGKNDEKPVYKTALVNAIRRVVAWVASDPDARVCCLITYKIVRLAIELVLDQENQVAQKSWAEAGMTAEDLAEAQEAIGTPLRSWRGQWILGHYGGVRGMNTAMHADTFVTLGDWRINLDAVRNDMAYLGKTGRHEIDARMKLIAESEHEQAHGRARDPERQTGCRHLHVGDILPSGGAWNGPEVDIVEMTEGPIAGVASMSGEEMREIRERLGLSQVEFARKLGLSESTVIRHEKGRSRIPLALTTRVVDMLRDV